MAINTDMSGTDLDMVMRAFLDAMSENNNDKVIYIRNGKLSFESGEKLFDVEAEQ